MNVNDENATLQSGDDGWEDDDDDNDDDDDDNYDNCSCNGKDLTGRCSCPLHATNVHELDLRKIIDNDRYKNAIIKIQAATNRVLDILEGKMMLPFCHTQFKKFKNVYNVTKGRLSELTAFYRNLQQYTCSRTYTTDVLKLRKCDDAH